MTVVNDGKNRIRDLLSADINISALGTSATAETVGDTDLGAEVVASQATPTQTVGNKIVNSKHILLSTVGNGTTFKEFGVYVNGGATLFNRVTFPDFAKTVSLELHSTTVIRIN